MKQLFLILSLVVTSAFADTPASSSPEKTLKGIVSGLLDALQDEDIDKCMAFFHPKAPNRTHTKQQYQSKFPTMELTFELTEFSYYGKDDKFAVARFTQKMGILEFNGQKFPDSRKGTVEMMVLFKQSGDDWKIWKSLEIDRKNPK